MKNGRGGQFARGIGSAAVVAFAAGSAYGQVTAVLCNIPGNPTAQVPGLPGVFFAPGPFNTDAFRRPYSSDFGSFWVLTARAGTVTSQDRVIIVGGPVPPTLVVREGTGSPFAGRNWGEFDTQVAVNEQGVVAFASNLSGPTVDDEIIATYVLNVPNFLAYQEGQRVGGLPVTAFFGADIGSPSITADSHVSAYSEITGPGITTQDDTILAFNGSAFEREGVTGPFGIIGPWRQFDIERFHVPAAGMYIARGQAEVFPGVTAQVAVVNGAVALREGLPAPSMFSAIVPNGIKGVAMFASGDWLARGVSDDPTEDWVVRSGNLAARRGGQIAPFNPTGELFSDNVFGDTFFAVGGNAMGDVIIGGFTNHPNTQRNEVLVLNGDRVVMREGDRVDLDADGVFDDDAFIAGFFPDSVVVTGGRANVVYALVPIRDAAGNIIGYAYVCVRSCVADFNGDGTVDFFDYDDFVNCFETGICPPGANADFNGDGSIDFFDYDDFISAFEAGCST